ncbi:MAG: DUF1343 domain-containing protein [Thermoanaerobaculia bacterium]
MVRTGLDRLLAEPEALRGRRYGLLAHAAAVSSALAPAHLALAALPGAAPSVLFGPEHGYYGVEQDMIAAAGGRDPWLELPVVSLYGSSAASLKPSPDAFRGLDLLLIDLQDVGSRYYTYAATAVWSAEVALEAGCEVWLLDRPNPLGGEQMEGNLPRPGFESFVGAFSLPVRHGLTLGELLALEARRRGWPAGWRVVPVEGWRRAMDWRATGRPWIAPSPNMPTPETAWLYPGGCLVEATELSEGRGTTRPFQLVGAPGLDALALCRELERRRIPGLAALPTRFRPQFQKHAGQLCEGVELVALEPERLPSYRAGLELLAACRVVLGEAFRWREAPYEFVSDRPAIDLLTGEPAYREAVEAGASFAEVAETWKQDERRFREERREILLYPEEVR